MRIDRLYPLLFVLNVAGFPLVAASSMAIGIQSSPPAATLRVSIIALSLVCIASAILRRHAGFVAGWYWVPLGLFWVAYIIRLAFSSTYESGALARDAIDYWAWAIGACLIPLLGMLVRVKADVWQFALRWSFLALAVASALVLMFGGTLVDGGGGDAYDTGRLRLEALNPISVGHLGASLTIVSGWLLLRARGQASVATNGVWIGGGLLGLFIMLAAASRGPIVSLLLVVLFGAVALHFKNSWKAAILALIASFTAYWVSAYFDNSGQFNTVTRLQEMFGGGDVNVSARREALAGAINQFLSSPLLGSALEEKATGYYPHNVIVEGFMATGILGGGAFLVLVLYGVWCSYRLMRLDSSHGWVALLFFQYVIGAQFSSALYNATMMWALLGAAICVYRGRGIEGSGRGVGRLAKVGTNL